MNSSGIKRGLATTAISALAVTGLPALASTAHATVGDNFTVTSTGPALNGGTEGAVVTIRFEDGEITPGDIKAVGTSGTTTGSEDTADQNVEVVGASAAYDDPSNSNFDLIDVRVAVTTTTTGDTATFRLFEDDNNPGTLNTLDANEARQTVAVSTAGPLASIDIAPLSQSTPQNIDSGAYTVTLKDSAGRTTQLAALTSVTVTDEAPVEANGIAADDAITSDEIARGTGAFTADPNGAAVGEYDITLNQGLITKTATLNVTEAANLGASEINIVTAADTWSDFGDDDAGITYVRVDQNTIRFDFNSDPNQPGANVQLTVDGTDIGPGNGVTFEGQAVRTYTTTLDSAGNGSITVTADAATVQEGDQVAVDINGFSQTIEFARAAFDSIESESDVYFCQDDASCTVTAIVKDQFGNPITTGEVEARRTGTQNVDATPQRKAVGPDGRVSFTFADTNPVDGGTDNVDFDYFLDQFDNTSEGSDSATIEYSATGQGSDYVVSLDGANTEAANYDSSAAGDSAVVPLSDTQANDDDEASDITIAGGEPNQAVTLSVDNGALILAPGEQYLSEGSASVETTTDGGGALAGYRIIGTKSGLVTLTVTSAQRTETAQFTVKAQDDVNSARNVTVSGPAEVEHGTNQITFTAVVTDAFGNPVAGVSTTLLNKQVSGPAFYQDGDTQSDANGLIRMNVRVDSDAEGDVTLTVDAADGTYQFGAAENRLTTADTTGNPGEGLSASSDIASATTTVKAGKVPAALTLKGGDNGAADDSLFANAINKTEGATVKLFRKRADGTWKKIRTGVMNAEGNFRFKDVNDLNGNGRTRYKAVVEATAETLKGIGKKTVR